MIGLYWAVLYVLQGELGANTLSQQRGRLHCAVGFCLVLLLARKDITKETLVYGVGIRFAIANWIQAAWAVSFVSVLYLGLGGEAG